jgi:DNA invertase Pin-like site-specific DNA recombinase
MLLGYIRVSTADQANGDRSSLQTQTDIIEGLARARGVDKWDVQIYEDAGVSGATKLKLRPAGERLLADMKAGDVVVASKLDRMFRSAADAIDMFETFKERGVDLILYDISHEPVSTGVGKLIMTILAAGGDMERVRIKERTADGRRAKKAKGGAVGKVPFGFRKEGEGRAHTLVADEGERRAEQRIHELAADRRLSYRAISSHLATEGLIARSGQPYSPSVIRRLVLAKEAQLQ